MKYSVITNIWSMGTRNEVKNFMASQFQDAVDYFRAMTNKANVNAVQLVLNVEGGEPIQLDYYAD